MTPSALAKSNTEHAHQVAFFAYCSVVVNHGFPVADEWVDSATIDRFSPERYPVPFLAWIHAIPNGGARGDSQRSNMIRGAALKAEGVRAGVADVFLPFAWGDYHGLYIEMKKPSVKPVRSTSKGGCSDDQISFRKHCDEYGYAYAVCYSWQEAVSTLKEYLGV
jgi:hypothetical protein